MAALSEGDRDELRAGAKTLGFPLTPGQLDGLFAHAELLLKWNKAINLTATTNPREVVEKHLLDSIAIAARVPCGSLLDAGSGGGFPGLPIALLRPDVQVTLVDSVQKKVAFLKSALAVLRLPNARALALRLGGDPAREGLPRFTAAVARAFASPEDWLRLAEPYVAKAGSVLVLLGARERVPLEVGELKQAEQHAYRLPYSGAQRTLLVYRRGVVA